MTDKDGKNVQPELYTEEEIEALESHIEEHFGNYSRVLHEIFSPDIHVDVCLIEPDEERDHYILVTMGMGAHVMNVPEDMADGEHERAELVMCLPADWDLQSHEERWYWPVRLLKTLARIPVSEDSWLGWGHTFEYGDGETFAENTELAAAILLDPSPYDCMTVSMSVSIRYSRYLRMKRNTKWSTVQMHCLKRLATEVLLRISTVNRQLTIIRFTILTIWTGI